MALLNLGDEFFKITMSPTKARLFKNKSSLMFPQLQNQNINVNDNDGDFLLLIKPFIRTTKTKLSCSCLLLKAFLF